MSKIIPITLLSLIVFSASCQKRNGDWIASLRNTADVETQLSRLKDRDSANPFRALGAMCEIVRNSALLSADERREVKALATARVRDQPSKVLFDLSTDSLGGLQSAVPYTADFIYISLLNEVGDYSEPILEVEELLDSVDLRARLATLDLIAVSGVASPAARSKIQIFAANGSAAIRGRALSAAIGLDFEPKILMPLLYSAIKAGGSAAQIAAEHLRVNGGKDTQRRIREICWSTSCDVSLLELHYELCKLDPQCLSALKSDKFAPGGTRLLMICDEARQGQVSTRNQSDYLELVYGVPEKQLGSTCVGKLGAFSPANVLKVLELSGKHPDRFIAADGIAELTNRDSPEVLDAIVQKLNEMANTDSPGDISWIMFFQNDLGRELIEKAIVRGKFDPAMLKKIPQLDLVRSHYPSDNPSTYEVPWLTRLGLAMRPYLAWIGPWLWENSWPKYDEFRPLGGCTERNTPLWSIMNHKLAEEPNLLNRLITLELPGLRPLIFQFSVGEEKISAQQFLIGSQDPDPRVRIAVANALTSAEISQTDSAPILELLSADKTPSVKWAARTAMYSLTNRRNSDEEG